jgi:hypothetical protein
VVTVILLVVAVVTDRFHGAAFHGFHAARGFFFILGLFEEVGITAVIVAGEIVRSRFAAEIAVDALIVHVKFALNVIFVAVVVFSHKCIALIEKTEIQDIRIMVSAGDATALQLICPGSLHVKRSSGAIVKQNRHGVADFSSEGMSQGSNFSRNHGAGPCVPPWAVVWC